MRTWEKRRRPGRPGRPTRRGRRSLRRADPAARPPRRRRAARARRARTPGRAPPRAAARGCSPPERCVSRRAITSRTLRGMASRSPPAASGSMPSSASRRTVSARNSGLPSVCSCNAAPELRRRDRRRRPLEVLSSPRLRSGRRARADGCPAPARPRPASRSAVARAQDRRRGSRRGRAGGSTRARGRETCSSTSDGGSAACRSSRTSTVGRAAHTLRRNSAVAQSSRNRAPSESREGGSGSPGSSSRSSGRIWASSTAPAPSCARRSSGADSRTYAAERLHPRPVGRRATRPPSSGR